MSGNDIKTPVGMEGRQAGSFPHTPLTEVIIIIRNHSQSQKKKKKLRLTSIDIFIIFKLNSHIVSNGKDQGKSGNGLKLRLNAR